MELFPVISLRICFLSAFLFNKNRDPSQIKKQDEIIFFLLCIWMNADVSKFLRFLGKSVTITKTFCTPWCAKKATTELWTKFIEQKYLSTSFGKKSLRCKKSPKIMIYIIWNPSVPFSFNYLHHYRDNGLFVTLFQLLGLSTDALFTTVLQITVKG